mgnify:CR=1 FL=1
MKKYYIFKESLGSVLSSNMSFGYYSQGTFIKDKEKAYNFENKKDANARLKELKTKYGNEFIKFKIID